MIARLRPSRGFTLIELMIVVTIVGMLSTVAFPVYKRTTLRARSAERGTMVQSMRTGIENAFFVEKIVPTAPARLNGLPNPAGLPGTGKRRFLNNQGDWGKISLVVQGDCYYSYSFTASEAGPATPALYSVDAVGDLDGDGVQPTKSVDARRVNGAWQVTIAPPDGEEDDVTFGSF